MSPPAIASLFPAAATKISIPSTTTSTFPTRNQHCLAPPPFCDPQSSFPSSNHLSPSHSQSASDLFCISEALFTEHKVATTKWINSCKWRRKSDALFYLLGKDPLKLEAESKLNDLIRSFSSLSGMAREGRDQLTLNSKQRVVDALKDKISSLNNFEQGIKDCLQV